MCYGNIKILKCKSKELCGNYSPYTLSFSNKEIISILLFAVKKTHHKKLLQYNEHYPATYLTHFPTTFTVKCMNNFANQ